MPPAARQQGGSAGEMPRSSAGRSSPGAGGPAPKGTGDASPGRLEKAVEGSAPRAPKGGAGAMPGSSWENLPRFERGSGGAEAAAVSVATREVALTGPPRELAREVSEMLRVERRMRSGVGTFGEDVV